MGAPAPTTTVEPETKPLPVIATVHVPAATPLTVKDAATPGAADADAGETVVIAVALAGAPLASAQSCTTAV
jgi:hypothetical protein